MAVPWHGRTIRNWRWWVWLPVFIPLLILVGLASLLTIALVAAGEGLDQLLNHHSKTVHAIYLWVKKGYRP